MHSQGSNIIYSCLQIFPYSHAMARFKIHSNCSLTISRLSCGPWTVYPKVPSSPLRGNHSPPLERIESFLPAQGDRQNPVILHDEETQRVIYQLSLHIYLAHPKQRSFNTTYRAYLYSRSKSIYRFKILASTKHEAFPLPAIHPAPSLTCT